MRMIKNILITGGSGLVGQAIKELLMTKGYQIAVLSRKNPNQSKEIYTWNIDKQELDPKAIEFADCIIHLAGENISSQRWTNKQKQKILSSRTASTNVLFNAISKSDKKPKLFISASAIGYYGTLDSDIIFKETDQSGNDFLAETTKEWESSVDNLKEFDLRLVKYRIGVVMSKKGGALPKMLGPLKFGFGTPLGSGKQYIPWVSLNDLSRLFLYAIQNEQINGAYNAVNTNHITNKALTKQLCNYKKKLFIPIGVPSLLLKLIFGKISSILLYGSRINNQKILDAGFIFKDQKIKDVLD